MSTQAEREERNKWNRLSETMSSFHNYFKQEFNSLYEVLRAYESPTQIYSRIQLADGSFTKRGLSLNLYLDMARKLNHHLTMHHTIEERHIFPVLSLKMKQFSTETEEGHIDSHKGIHEGLEDLETLVKKFKKDPTTYSPDEMRACLDGFREILFTHLDQEVEDLRGENLKKYLTLQELEMLPVVVLFATCPTT
ncbi:hemerythrin HHE cation binding domain-containing protein [Mycena amicta]|nr:hemerythrin HHE cation binding domain-containing protein [Mycena amicta]